MIIEFKAGNYRSIRDEQTLSFVGSNYSSELPNNFFEADLPGMTGTRILKSIALYGANASGKSNLLDALKFFANFVSNSFTSKPGAPTGTRGFGLDYEQIKRPTTFEVTIIVRGMRYAYGLSLDQSQVTEEYLVAFPNSRAQTWFERSWNEERQAYDISAQTDNFRYDDALAKITNDRKNATFISVANQFAHPQVTPVFEWFDKSLRVIELGTTRLSPNITARHCVDDSLAQKAVFTFVQSADLGITELAVIKKPEEEIRKRYPETFAKLLPLDMMEEYNITMHHKGAKGSVPLEFEDESDGTRRIFELAGPWMDALIEGHLICMDEIERSLHPYLVRDLIQLIMNPEINTKGTQLLFTTHNPLLLDQTLLRRDQFWFTDKDEYGATHLYPLTDYKPRPGEALMKGYMVGRYGAVPFIPDGLVLKP